MPETSSPPLTTKLINDSLITNICPVSLVECPPERQLSALLFGNRHKLELLAALAMAEDDGVNLSLLAASQAVPVSVYYGPVKDLVNAGLVHRLERTPGDRRRWYRRTNHRFWECVRPLVDELTTLRMEAS